MWAVVKIMVPFLNIRCRIIIRIQEAIIILTTTHVRYIYIYISEPFRDEGGGYMR